MKTLLLGGRKKIHFRRRMGDVGGSTETFHCRCEGGGCVGGSVEILAPAGGPAAEM